MSGVGDLWHSGYGRRTRRGASRECGASEDAPPPGCRRAAGVEWRHTQAAGGHLKEIVHESVDGARERQGLETERRTEASQNTVTTPHPSLTCLYCNYASEEGSRKIRGESIPRPACTCSACWTSEVVHAMHISCVMGCATFVPVRPLSPELLDLKEGVRVLHLRAVEAGQVDLAIDGDARIGCERDHVAQ